VQSKGHAVIAVAVVVAYNLELAERRKRVVRIVLEHNLEEVAVPIVVDKGAAEVAHMVVVHREVEVAVPNLAVDLDHKTWIIPPVGYALFLIAPFEANVQYHTTGVRANRQV
jgi:hypothetical protein